VNYNQVVVKCQILQECFLQNFNMQKFQNIQIQELYKDIQAFTLFSRFSRARNLFFKIQGLSRHLKDPMNPACHKLKSN